MREVEEKLEMEQAARHRQDVSLETGCTLFELEMKLFILRTIYDA